MPWQPDYATLPEAKTYLRVDDAVDDLLVAGVLTAASRIIDRATNRQFGLVAAPEARKYTARRDPCRRRWVVEFDDLMTQTGLTIATPDGTVNVFALQPSNAATEGDPWTRVVVDPDSAVKPTGKEDEVTVTARWGWTTVPETIKQATLLQLARLFVRRGAPFGVAGSPDLGNELRLLAKIDPDVAVMVGPYMRWWGVT